MATLLLVLVVVLVIAGLVYGVVSLLAGDDPGLVPAEPDGWARPLPNDRSLHEDDLQEVRFDVGLRGYRMSQVDRVLRRTAYDLGYKDEMIAVLEAEVAALREGRIEDADALRAVREEAGRPATQSPAAPSEEPDEPESGGELDGVAALDGADLDKADLDKADLDGADLDKAEVVDFDTAPPDEPRAQTERSEPREGSLLRREPRPEPDSILTAASAEAADRPAHA